ncbi:MAG TPA: efflux RND transporter periplasmic adaptor subunit [Thermoanaerobaculia bacterium]|jgi:Cu(I)/Ag(I) efflux system membrane fusion protein|nr:efflux RND transporter periplasmic adaptor subunit [Thermoanaerobaculia bacterium]
MKNTLILLLSIAALVALGCGEKKSVEPERAAEVKVADVYTCPMHPSIVSDKPGSCPICGMTLVKQTAAAAPTNTDIAAVSLSPEQRVTANVKTVRVALDTHTGEIVTTGRVTFDERRVAQVTSYTAGRVERLFVNFTGDSVRRGETVATIYSPELFATQQEYLLALENRERMRRAGFTGARSASEDLVESTRRRLNLFGMTAAQIAQLEKSHKPIFATNIISTVSGVVTQKLAVQQQYVAMGQPLLEVADLSNVWVEADVYEQQLPSVKLGDRVEISVTAIPGRTFVGKVAFIVPVLAGATRTAKVRVDLANPGLQLKPDMYVNARILGAPAPPHIMVPASAVVDRGQKQFVWVETQPGSYEPREVMTGGRHGESIVIVSGLSAGDNVVVEGGFLLDSEAQLRGGHAH